MGNGSARSLVGEDEAALWQGAAAAVVEDQRFLKNPFWGVKELF